MECALINEVHTIQVSKASDGVAPGRGWHRRCAVLGLWPGRLRMPELDDHVCPFDFVSRADHLYQDYEKSGAIIRQPPTTFPWGVRAMNVEDLDGHRLRIGY